MEKRIALGSVLNVRVHSKLKFEFELVCTSRSFRLRAPSAQVKLNVMGWHVPPRQPPQAEVTHRGMLFHTTHWH